MEEISQYAGITPKVLNRILSEKYGCTFSVLLRKYRLYQVARLIHFNYIPIRHANLKYKYGNRHFWCRGYYVDTVGKNTKAIKEYIQNQLQEDIQYDQMTLNEYIDPFTGEPVKKNKK